MGMSCKHLCLPSRVPQAKSCTFASTRLVSGVLSLRAPLELLSILFTSQLLHRALHVTPPTITTLVVPSPSLGAPSTIYLVFALLNMVIHAPSPTQTVILKKQELHLTNVYTVSSA